MSVNLIYPSVAHFKGILDHLKSTNGSTNTGVFIFGPDSFRYQSVGFSNRLLNEIVFYTDTFRYDFDSEEEIEISVNIINFRTQLSSYNKKYQLQIEKKEEDQFITIRPLNENSMPDGHESQLTVENHAYDKIELPVYRNNPNFTIDTNILSKNLSNICMGSKEPEVTLYCNKDGIMFNVVHGKVNVSRYTIGKSPLQEEHGKYPIDHDIIKSLGKLSGINKDKMTRIYYEPNKPLKLFVPIGNENGELNICIDIKSISDIVEDIYII